MKELIIQNIKTNKKYILKLQNNLKKLEDIIIKMRLYNTKYSNLIKILLLLSDEFTEIENDIEKMEETVCHLIQKW